MKKQSFKLLQSNFSLPAIEEEVLAFWEQNQIFEKSVSPDFRHKDFFFYDGPPFATGTPHYGHILAGTIKDIVPRYFTMKGFRVERRFGWDCHGLPVEYEAEKELGTKGRPDIIKMGIAEFNEYCRSIVLRYTQEWKRVVRRMARWVDLENDYKTMDPDFMESIWWVFKTLWDKDLVYQSLRILPYSARLSTPLSNFEVNQNYRMTQDPSVTIRFKALDEENTYYLGWTTTPWTLPSNLALCVNPLFEYVKVRTSVGDQYYLGKEALQRYAKDLGEYELLGTVKGEELEHRKYVPLFPYFASHAESGSFIITLGEHVTSETGTGVVHTAPMFGEDDFAMGKKYNLPVIMPINDSGEFNAEVSDFEGLFFKDADKLILRMLKENGQIFRQETIEHNYPFCWRSDTPLMYRAIPSWFVNVEKIKSRMVAHNATVHYCPEHIRDGRMGKWLENARDWCVSRNRFWGTTIPVWICPACDHRICVGSRSELTELSGHVPDDLHSHFIDQITFPCPKCNNSMKRTPEVLDCWFESGSMPYAQEHYPFKNKERFERNFPADFVSEGIDQTRGWFYTLMVLGTALFDVPAYKNNIVSGLILAENGEKMSKRLKNYPDPEEMINNYGADTIRLYMLNSGAIKAEDLKFSEHGLRETLKNQLIPLFNSLIFFKTYSKIDGWIPDSTPVNSSNALDIWIQSRFNRLVVEVTAALDDYDLFRAVKPLVGFIDELTNWYIRRSRRRFWKEGIGDDKSAAYSTLYHVLKGFSCLIAPLIPYSAERIYQELRTDSDPESVHLEDFPLNDPLRQNPDLDRDMDIVIQMVSMGRHLRASKQIKVRQPLKSVTLVTSNPETRKLAKLMEKQIIEELNVKSLNILDNEEELVSFSARPNLPLLGPRYGKMLKEIGAAVRELDSGKISHLLKGEILSLKINGTDVELKDSDLLIDRHQKPGLLVETRDNLIVAMDESLDEALINEGLTREMINRIQNARKQAKLEISDRISLNVSAGPKITDSLNQFADYLRQETLADEINLKEPGENLEFSDTIGEESVSFSITKLT